MHREDIKSALRKCNSSFSIIARELDIKCGTVSRVAIGPDRSRRIERAISEKLDMPLFVVFPDRYPAPEGTAPEMVEMSTTELNSIMDALLQAAKLVECAVLKHKAP